MFLGFFYFLREKGLKVSIGDWMMLLEGMEKGLRESTLEGFYFLCRAVLLRDESEFDLFDQAFAEYFRIKLIHSIQEELTGQNIKVIGF